MVVNAVGSSDRDGYRFLGAVAVLNLLLVLLQPVGRRLGGTPSAAPAPPARKDTHDVTFRLRGTPSEAAIEEARQALERGGATVERVDRAP